MKKQKIQVTPDVVTKENLKGTLLEVLDDYAIKKELIDLERRLETTLGEKINNNNKMIMLQIKLTSEEIVEKTKELLTGFKDVILTTVDPLLKELETRQEDRELSSNKLEEFDKRLTLLEKHVGISVQN